MKMLHNYLHLEIKVKINVNHPKRLLNTSTGGSSGGCGGCNPPNFPKTIVVIRLAVVIDLVVTSSNNACLCALNGVTV